MTETIDFPVKQKGSQQRNVKKIFWELGTCSQTLFHILNREFGCPREPHERASDSLAGGILQEGHQCGMLWGATLAVGAEAYRRSENLNQATRIAVTSTQHLMKSFSNRVKSINCREITGCDFTSKLSTTKYLVTGKFLDCFNLAENWVPEAIEAATQGLAQVDTNQSQQAMSCASEVLKKMGASEEKTIMVAGFAGGLGLSGNACGALSAAIWMKSFDHTKEKSTTAILKNPNLKNILVKFHKETNQEILCNKVSGQHFSNLDEHTQFLTKGGCRKLIDVLASV